MESEKPDTNPASSHEFESADFPHSSQVELDSFAAHLQRTQFPSQGLDRDALMFAAGQASLRAELLAAEVPDASTASASKSGPNHARAARPYHWHVLGTLGSTAALLFISVQWWRAESDLKAVRGELAQARRAAPMSDSSDVRVSKQPPGRSEESQQTRSGEEPTQEPAAGERVSEHRPLLAGSNTGHVWSLLFHGLSGWTATDLAEGRSGNAFPTSRAYYPPLIELRNALLQRSSTRTWPVAQNFRPKATKNLPRPPATAPRVDDSRLPRSVWEHSNLRIYEELSL